ncbi:MAG: PaaI family thioesterase [Caulobacter sp.]|nr:PaaI family thioesterase [Caulobacter sp.]
MTAVLDPAVADRITAALHSQGLFQHMGARIEEIVAGGLTMALPFRPEVAQQHGFFHGGAIGFLVDNTTTAAAGTVLRPGEAVLTAEYKLNILSAARGGTLVCRASVVKPGRMLIPVEAKVFNRQEDGGEKLVAVGLATIAVIAAERVGGQA